MREIFAVAVDHSSYVGHKQYSEQINLMLRIGQIFLILALLAACGPSAEELAEKRRIECLDKFCEGDIAPQTAPEEMAVKLNGQFFIAPKSYVMGFSGLAFYWPSKTPATGRSDRQPYPEQGLDFNDTAIEISLRSREGVTDRPGLYAVLQQAEVEGLLISKLNPRPGLEIWRINENNGLRPLVWYVATEYREPGGDPPVIACDESNPEFDRCTTGFIWQPGISMDMRFRAKHGPDWPEIYQETMRILQLLKKV